MAAKSSIKSPSSTQAETMKSLGGLPPTKSSEAVAKVNTPGGRKAAPDSFRPSR